MYQQIKKLADDAIALQNKNVMDGALRKISEICTPEHVVYGEAKSYESEAEMIADTQGVPSPVFPLPDLKEKKGGAK